VLACTHYTELLDVRRFARQPGLALWEMQAQVGKLSEWVGGWVDGRVGE